MLILISDIIFESGLYLISDIACLSVNAWRSSSGPANVDRVLYVFGIYVVLLLGRRRRASKTAKGLADVSHAFLGAQRQKLLR